MARMRGGEEGEKEKQQQQQQQAAGLVRLAQTVTLLVVFAGGVVIGLVTSSHISKLHILSQPYAHFQYTIDDSSSSPDCNNICNNNCTSKITRRSHELEEEEVVAVEKNKNKKNKEVDMMEAFLHPSNITHTLSDDELFWRASLVPNKEEYPYTRIPKVAFMFLTRGPLPFIPLWERFFQGHSNLFNIYIHAPPGYFLNVSLSSPFYARNIPSQPVSWGTVTLADAERRLLANALLDFSNDRFILLSESCIPVYNFPTIYRYLIDSSHSFVESYDEPSRYGRGRYSRSMLPHIHLKHWRKGSQWFELSRPLAVYIVSDTLYYSLFRRYCKPACYPDEHYLPTFINMFHGPLNSNRSVTWVDWSMLGPHPATYGRDNITVSFIQAIRNSGSLCRYNSEMTSICYLFARKFHPSALQPLLDLSLQVMNF